VGRAFDPRRHEAVEAVPAGDGTAPGVVVAEIQRGYLLGDDVLRPARVRVAQ
jgi:molecular chaperone GrpE